MNKSELNKKWAELEGWEYDPHFLWMEGESEAWIDSDGFLHATKPDWTEPNHFFAEVVPRMKELRLYPEASCTYSAGGWLFVWLDRSSNNIGIGTGDSIGKSGLEAAIKAREGLNV